MPPILSILIVTYNSSAVIGACLASIAAGTQVAHEIILVDNGSQDDTLGVVRRDYPAVRVTANGQNRGFAVAVNQASHLAQGRLLLLLNPDTVVHPGALDTLVMTLDAQPKAGLCAPRTLNVDGSLRSNCFPFPSFWTIFLHNVLIGPVSRVRRFLQRPVVELAANRIQQAQSLSGAALLVRADLYRTLTGLDERFFMYYEDEDLCYRAQQAGYTNLFVPTAVVTHAGGHSTPRALAHYGRKVDAYFLASQYRYLQKHATIWARIGIRLVYLLTGIVFGCLGCLSRDPRKRSTHLKHSRLRLTMACLPNRSAGGSQQDDRRKETHINRALRRLKGHTYLEIGTRAGACFNQITAPRKIGIDPAPQGGGAGHSFSERCFTMTSDEFFAAHAEQLFQTERVDVALIDGLHTFDQALRDLLHLEQVMAPRGVIFIHDMNPPTRNHSELRNGGVWCGDVWKVAYYIRNYRPDLTLFTLDCDWGVGVLTGFGAATSAAPSAAILEECQQIDYDLLERQRHALLRLRPVWYSHLFFRFLHPQWRWGEAGS
jgi:hypothetical protein